MHETEEKTLNGLVPRGMIRASQNWFRRFQGQRVGDPRPCPHCGETTVWKNGYRTDRTFAVLIVDDGFDEVTVELQRYQCSECHYSFDGESCPPKKGAKKDLYEENMRRKQEDEQPKKWSERFTVGSSYLPQLGCFAGIQCRNTVFARAVALALVFPLRGVDYWLTDDHDAYNDILPDRVKCLVHRLRTRARGDERVSELHKAGKLAELRDYLEEEYEAAYEELVAQLKQDYPSFWDAEAEEFTGPVSTNAIEGGNWRLKHDLVVPYARCRGGRARISLISLRDSMSTFKNREPAESFAHRHGSFSFDQVLGETSHRR